MKEHSTRGAKTRHGAGRIAVVGSINIDRIWNVPQLPQPGQTLLARTTRREFGGKGANQAVSAARQGARVTLVGAVGGDPDAPAYLRTLAGEGINTNHIAVRADRETGTAHVYVDDAGENAIVVHPGANDCVDAMLVERALRAAPRPALLLVQLECPLTGVATALRLAAEWKVPALLNASPAQAGFPWGSVAIDTLLVNEHECAAALGCSPAELLRLRAPARASLLQARRIRHVVVTQGSEPTLHIAARETHVVPTFPVKPVDTVGAGDTFAGILAARLVENTPWPEALRQANAGAALSTLWVGAQNGMPSRADLERAVSRSAESRASRAASTGADGVAAGRRGARAFAASTAVRHS